LASYLILDGYNVIGALDRYRPAATGGLDESRELLINDAL
jgi:predicted RNA-binding protein with PIN domain